MTQYLFRNVELLDPAQDRLLGGREVLVEDELIREVSDRPIGAVAVEAGPRASRSRRSILRCSGNWPRSAIVSSSCRRWSICASRRLPCFALSPISTK